MIGKKFPVFILLLIFILGFALTSQPTWAQGTTATSTGEFVELTVGNQEVVVDLISKATELAGISVRALEIGDLIGVETFDPLERYLPAVNILPKRSDGRVILKLAQTPRTDRYRIRQLGAANVAPFWTSVVGTTTAEQLHTLLASQDPPKTGLNLLLPAQASGQLTVFRTPLPSTVLVVPSSLLPDPQNRPSTLNVPSLILMQVADLHQSPYDYLNKATTAPIPNLVGVSTLKFGVADTLDLATAPLSFRYGVNVVSCDKQFGEIIEQTPAPGTNVNPFADTVQLKVCEAFLRMPGQSVAATYLRTTPMLTVATIMRTVPNATALTVIGRTANNSWLQVQLSDGSQGWLSAQTVKLQGDITKLQIVDVPSGAFLSAQTQITQGQCVTISWRIENAVRIVYKGNTVQASGSSLECLSQSSTFLLQVTGNDRQIYNISLTVQVVTRGY